MKKEIIKSTTGCYWMDEHDNLSDDNLEHSCKKNLIDELLKQTSHFEDRLSKLRSALPNTHTEINNRESYRFGYQSKFLTVK